MSLHTPPSSYILRDLSEVVTPEHVSWLPQTLGWKIIAIALIVFSIYKAIKWGKKWWGNRYRREALTLVISMKVRLDEQAKMPNESQVNQQISHDVFEVMKAAVVYLNPKHAPAFGNDFLCVIDGYFPQSSSPFYDDIGKGWMKALVQSKNQLTYQELQQLLILCEAWLRHHQGVANVN